ncbi:MAG: c-type cytochrome [Pirellulales bacterium]
MLDKSHITHVKETEILKPDDPEKETNPKRYLREVEEADYFGNTKHKTGEMANYVLNDMTKGLETAEPKDETVDKKLSAIAAALSAEAKLPRQAIDDSKDAALIKQGLDLLSNSDHCAACHHVRGADNKDSGIPDLEHYASRDWTAAFIANPAHDRFYGADNDRMPAFAPNAGGDAGNQLSKHDIDLLARWLRQED